MKRNVGAGILLLLLIFLVGALLMMYQKNRLSEANITAMADTLSLYQNRLGGKTATIRSLELSNRNFRNTILQNDKKLKALAAEFNQVNTVVKYVAVTKVDTVSIAYPDTIPCSFERTGTLREKWLELDYRADSTGISITNLTLPDTTVIVTGKKRNWFLGKEVLVTDITHSNPYIKVTVIKSAEVTAPSPWYRKWYLWLAAGLVGGLMIK